MCNGLRLKSDQDELDAVLDPARLLEPVSHTPCPCSKCRRTLKTPRLGPAWCPCTPPSKLELPLFLSFSAASLVSFHPLCFYLLSSLPYSLLSHEKWREQEQRAEGMFTNFSKQDNYCMWENKSHREQGLKKIQKQLPFWSKLKTKASDASRLLMTNWVI